MAWCPCTEPGTGAAMKKGPFGPFLFAVLAEETVPRGMLSLPLAGRETMEPLFLSSAQAACCEAIGAVSRA